jgi:hypothetical protein
VSPLIRSLTKKACASPFGSITLNPPKWCGRTIVSHFTLAFVAVLLPPQIKFQTMLLTCWCIFRVGAPKSY